MSTKIYKLLSILLIMISSLLNASSQQEDGLPIFWWKEGDFVNFGDYISYKMVEKLTGFRQSITTKERPTKLKNF